MKIVLIFTCLIIATIYTIRKQKVKKTKTSNTSKDYINIRITLDSLLDEYIELANNLKRTISSSSEILNLNVFSLDRDLIKEQINLAHQNGKFDNIINHFIQENSESIDYIINNLLEIAKKTSPLNDLQLYNIDLKTAYIISDLQSRVTYKLEKTSIFNTLENEEIKLFLMDLIKESRTKLIKFHLDL